MTDINELSQLLDAKLAPVISRLDKIEVQVQTMNNQLEELMTKVDKVLQFVAIDNANIDEEIKEKPKLKATKLHFLD